MVGEEGGRELGIWTSTKLDNLGRGNLKKKEKKTERKDTTGLWEGRHRFWQEIRAFRGSKWASKFSAGFGKDDKDDGDDHEEEEFRPILSFEEVMRETRARGTSFPSNMLTAAKSVGIQRVLILRYLDLQGDSLWFLLRHICGSSKERQRLLGRIWVVHCRFSGLGWLSTLL